MPEHGRPYMLIGAGAALAAVALAAPAAAQDVDPPADPLTRDFGAPAFMLTDDERARIRRAEAAAERAAVVKQKEQGEKADSAEAEPDPKQPLEPVYVSGIMRLSERTWTVWLGRTRLSPGTQGSGPFTVRWIGDNRVRLTWDPPDRKESYTFTLGPRQSFVPATGRVVDGRADAPRSVSVVGGADAGPDTANGDADGAPADGNGGADSADAPQTAAQGGADGGG